MEQTIELKSFDAGLGGLGREAAISGTALVEFAEETRCVKVAGTLSLLANPKRLKILCLLSESDRSVDELVRALGSSMSATSQQLKLLTLSNVLERRREGRNIFYKLKDEKVLAILHLLKSLYS